MFPGSVAVNSISSSDDQPATLQSRGVKLAPNAKRRPQGRYGLDPTTALAPMLGPSGSMGIQASDPGIDWVRDMLEEAVERKRRLLGLFGGWIH